MSSTAEKLSVNSKLVYLTMSIDNVPHWGFWEAFREILQNALDMKEHNLYLETDSIAISTFDGPLLESTLLIGNSSKRDDDNAIGKYGEGYKLACLILLREGYDVKIRNGLDLWVFKEVLHPQLGCMCVAVDIEYNVFPSDNELSRDTVTFSIKGVTSEDLNEIDEKYLERDYIRDNFDVVADHNKTLMFKGQDTPTVYVNGLYVCNLPENYHYSYNFTPDMIPLDRDRSAVNTWELSWTIADFLEKAEMYDLITSLSENHAPDLHEYYSPSTARFYTSSVEGTSVSEKLAEVSLKNFRSKYGDNAFPISSELKHEKAKLYTRAAAALGLDPIVVPKGLFKLLPSSVKKIDLGVETSSLTPVTLLQTFLTENKKHMRSKAVKKFNRLLDTIVLMS